MTVPGLLTALRHYDEIAQEFIAKVDAGQVHSTRTYAALKQALDRSKQAQETAGGRK